MVEKDTSHGTRRQLIKMAGVAGAGLAGVGSASASGGKVFRAKVSCTKQGGKIEVKNVSNRRIEIRDIDGEGLNVIDGRPRLKPGKTLTLKNIPDGEAVLRAYKPGKNKPLTDKRTYRVECEKEKPKPKCDITFHDNCRRVRVKCDKKVKVKAYTKKEHKWGGKVIEKETKDFNWSLKKKGNYFTKVKVYYHGKKIAEKHCDRERKPKCDISFHDNCRRVRVKCDKKVKVKAYTKKEHKWGGKVIEKETKDFRWSVQKKGNYFTKVKVYYEGEQIAKKYCEREAEPEPECDITFHKNCRRVRVKCDKKVRVKAYTKKEHKWGGKTIEKETKEFDWTLQKKGNYFTKVEVYYKGERIAKEECERDGRGGGEKPKVECDTEKAVVKNVPQKLRRGTIAVKATKHGKTDWKGISLKWVKPGDSRKSKKGSVRLERKKDRVVIHAKSGWKLRVVKGEFKGHRFHKKCKKDGDDDGKKPKVECDTEKAVVKNVPQKLRKGTIAVKAENKHGKTDWKGISLKWVKPGDSRKSKKGSVRLERKKDRVVIHAKSGWKLRVVKGKFKGHKFHEKCKEDHDGGDDGHGKPKVKFHGKRKAVVKNIPDKCRKGTVAGRISKHGKRDWAGISLKWVKPGDTRKKDGMKFTRPKGKNKVVIKAKRKGWKLTKVNGKVKHKKFEKEKH